MKIGYSPSLWDREKRGFTRTQRLDWRFEHLGLRRCIPCVYHFKEGIVFDLLTLLEAEEVRAYYDRYSQSEDRLTPAQRRCAEQESPLRELALHELWLDGRRAEGWSSSGAARLPFSDENRELDAVRRAYRGFLGKDACFHCQRFRVPYPGAVSAGRTLLRSLRLYSLSSMRLVTQEQRRFYPLDLRFTLSDRDPRRELRFTHPVTGGEHRLYFELGESVRLPRSTDAERRFFSRAATYETDPPLPPDSRLEFDSGTSCSYSPEDRLSPEAASSVIIGGACGPTAIFMAPVGGQREAAGPHGLPLRACFSVITREEGGGAPFFLQGLDERIADGETYEYRR